MCRIYKDGRIFDSLDRLIRFRMGISADETHKRFAYRGHADENWHLAPRLFRKHGQDERAAKQTFINNRMTSWQFISDLLEANVLPGSFDLTYLQLLAVAQHYPEYEGACGTELLDFSWSLRVAASFAFRATSEEQVGVIYLVYPPELKELYLGIIEEIELPDFFVRPTRQKAVFMRQFSPGVNEPAHLDKYYFRQNGAWPSSLGPEFTQDHLLTSAGDPVLRFSQEWTPHVSPKISELDLRYLLETEYHFLGMATGPKAGAWIWLDTIQEAFFHLFRGLPDNAQSLLSSLQMSSIQEALTDKALSQEVVLIIELIRSTSLQLQGNTRAAEERIRNLLAHTDSAETTKILLNHLGGLYLKSSRRKEALGAYTEADRLTPSDLVTIFNLATTLKAMGRYEDALRELNKIVFEIDSEDALSWSERANTLNNLRQFRSAIDSAERALELDPALAYAWGHMGVSWTGLFEHQTAVDCFRKMLRLRPRNAWALFNLAAALYYAGQRSESLETFGLLSEVNPNYPRLGVLAQLIGAAETR